MISEIYGQHPDIYGYKLAYRAYACLFSPIDSWWRLLFSHFYNFNNKKRSRKYS